jgi:hypothetical protein
LVIDETDEHFDAVGLVEYPSREAFLQVAQDDRVQAIALHHEAALESQWLFAATETEFRFEP